MNVPWHLGKLFQETETQACILVYTSNPSIWEAEVEQYQIGDQLRLQKVSKSIMGT